MGAALMGGVLGRAGDLGLRRLESGVRITAQPLFARFGFAVVEQRVVAVRGVALANARMRRMAG